MRGMEKTEDMSQINRVALRMPAFWPEEPELWFAQLESQFIICGITQDSTKYAYALSQIDTKHAREIKDLITNPPAAEKYETIKKTLISRLSVSQEQRTRQLLEHEELGDRKPSQFLRHLKTLAGQTVPDTLLRTLWMGRLPTQTQIILATRTQDCLDDVAEQADKIHEVDYRAVVATATKQKATTTENSLEEQIKRLTKQVASLTAKVAQRSRKDYRERSRSRSRSRYRYRNEKKTENKEKDNGVCYYHRRFKGEATKCAKPCTYKAENTEGSH